MNVCKIFTTLEKVERLSEEVEAVKGTIAGLETEIRSTIDGIKGEVQGVFDDAAATKAFAEEKFGSALADIQDATKNVDALKSQFTEASKGIEDIRGEMDGFKESLAKITSQVTEFQQKIDEFLNKGPGGILGAVTGDKKDGSDDEGESLADKFKSIF